MPKKVENDHTELLQTARLRFDASIQAESDYRTEAIIDRKFVDGDQWPEYVKKLRRDRVVAVVNKTRIMRNNVVGNAMDINIKPIVSPKKGTDDARAKIMDKLIADIYDRSKVARVNRSALKDAATSGLGYIIIRPQFDATGFHQHLTVEYVSNPLTVYSDPAALDFLHGDARWKFVTGVLSKEDFQAEYPNATQTSFSMSSTGDRAKEHNWHDQEGIVVAEYYYRVPQIVQRAKMVTGEVFELTDEITPEYIESQINPKTQKTFQIDEIKDIKEYTVMWAKINGQEVLEGPYDLRISKIPIIPVIGYDENIEGKKIYRGVVYDMRDPQRMYNYHYASQAEIIAGQTSSPYIMFDDMLDDHTRGSWDNLAVSNPSYLLVKRTPGNILPRRETPPVASSGNDSYMARADKDMQDVTGIFSSTIGRQDNARSKVAINARQFASNKNTRIIIDNWIEAILEVGTRLLEWIPIIHDTEQTIEVTAESGEKEIVVINQTTINPKTKEKIILNDLSEGEYDYVIQPGSAGMTSRQEQLMAIQEFTQNLPPEIKIMFADIVADLSGMPKNVVDRLEKVIAGLSGQQPEQPVPAEIENA